MIGAGRVMGGRRLGMHGLAGILTAVTIVGPSLLLATPASAGVAVPTIATTASLSSVGSGTDTTDTATLSGGTNPTGTITFNLLGPDDFNCDRPPVFTSTIPVNGAGSYVSQSFHAVTPGTYQWVAAYSGDANNVAVISPCNDPAEQVAVTAPPPVILTTQATPPVIGPGGLSILLDSATLAGGISPTGTITFNLYGPNVATCSGPPAFTSTIPVPSFPLVSQPVQVGPGTYRWVATYSGDANNAGVSTACGDPLETVVVIGPPSATISTNASFTSIGSGTDTTDTAMLAGGFNPVGTITFNLLGPDDTNCDRPPAFTSVVPVNGNGTYQSAAFHAVTPGIYRWVASYSGDPDNLPVTTSCNDPNELVPVAKFATLLSTQASGPAPVGDVITDTAFLNNTNNASGTITFDLFGPDDPTCAGPPAFVSVVAVAGNGNYVSGPFFPTVAGTYQWVASYAGDTNNQSAAAGCGDPAETVVVTPPPPPPPTKGFLTICKARTVGVTGNFTFTVEGRTFTVAAGQCTPSIRVTPGEVTVTEAPRSGFRLVRCTTTPADRLVVCNRHAGTAVVRIDPGGVGKQTIVSFTNQRTTGTLKICKVAGTGVAVGTRHVFAVDGRKVIVKAGPAPGGGCVVAGIFPVGTQVLVAERFKAGESVQAIDVRPARRIVGTPDLPNRRVTVKIGTGITEVSFTDTQP